MRRSAIAGIVLLAALLAAPATAGAAPRVTTHVVGRTSGVEIAGQLLGHLSAVNLGSGSATVTLDVDGHRRPVRVEFGELAKGAGHASGRGLSLVALAAMPLVAGVFFRAVRFLSSLGRA